MKKWFIVYSLIFSSILSGNDNASDQLIQKYQELSALGKKITEQKKVVSDARKEYEFLRDKLIKRILVAIGKETNSKLADQYAEDFEDCLQKVWNNFVNEKQSIFTCRLITEFVEVKYLDDFDKQLLIYQFIRTGYELNLLSIFLAKWDSCVNEIKSFNKQ
ncbi:MAG: hypothetical protein ACOYT8_00555 [Candidatus Dependentiae bacterium]